MFLDRIDSSVARIETCVSDQSFRNQMFAWHVYLSTNFVSRIKALVLQKGFSNSGGFSSKLVDSVKACLRMDPLSSVFSTAIALTLNGFVSSRSLVSLSCARLDYDPGEIKTWRTLCQAMRNEVRPPYPCAAIKPANMILISLSKFVDRREWMHVACLSLSR